MRAIPTAVLCLATLVLVGGTATAGSPSDPEIPDATGDVGPAPGGAEPAGAEADIVASWFVAPQPASSSDEAADPVRAASDCLHPCRNQAPNGTWAAMEVAAFEHRPPGVIYEVAFTVDGHATWVAFGSIPNPDTGEIEEGFYGCRSTHGDEGAARVGSATADRHGDCQWLEGVLFDAREGFRVRVPDSWAPEGALLEETSARTYVFAELPEDDPEGWGAVEQALVLDHAGPGEAFQVPEDASNGTEEVEQASTPKPEPGRANEAPTPGGVAVLAGLAVLGWATRRPGRSR